MNLKNRLKNLETKAGITNSAYCMCYGSKPLKREVLPISIDEWKRRTAAGEETLVKLPDKCERCEKSFDKRFIEVSFEEMRETINARRRQAAETVAMFAD